MENNKDFPNFFQALFILAVLFGIELLAGAAFIDFHGRFELGNHVANEGAVVVLSVKINRPRPHLVDHLSLLYKIHVDMKKMWHGLC
jgi:hypothetical protein